MNRLPRKLRKLLKKKGKVLLHKPGVSIGHKIHEWSDFTLARLDHSWYTGLVRKYRWKLVRAFAVAIVSLVLSASVAYVSIDRFMHYSPRFTEDEGIKSLSKNVSWNRVYGIPKRFLSKP